MQTCVRRGRYRSECCYADLDGREALDILGPAERLVLGFVAVDIVERDERGEGFGGLLKFGRHTNIGEEHIESLSGFRVILCEVNLRMGGLLSAMTALRLRF